MAHYVKCLYCGRTFDRDKTPCIKVSDRRYAHENCEQTAEEKKKTKEQEDKEKLENYIKEVYGDKASWALIKRQMKKYIEDDHFTYSGMLGALKYFYEVRREDVAKSRGGIGIIGYVYDDARNYYKALWEAQQINDDKDIRLYIPQTEAKEIKIKAPKREVLLKRIFTFLDEED